MKCNANGRTYRLVLWFPFFRLTCRGCAFRGHAGCCPKSTRYDTVGVSCARGDGINRVWRETILSMARRVAIYVLVGERDRYNLL